jgi:hypothetical protein
MPAIPHIELFRFYVAFEWISISEPTIPTCSLFPGINEEIPSDLRCQEALEAERYQSFRIFPQREMGHGSPVRLEHAEQLRDILP